VYDQRPSVSSIKEVTYLRSRRLTIKRRRIVSTPLCAICGGDTELISVSAAARCAGISQARLCDWLEGLQVPATTSFQQTTLVCLGCLSRCQKKRFTPNS